MGGLVEEHNLVITGGSMIMHGIRHGENKARGLTFVSILLILGVVAFFILTGLKLYPGYYESFNVRTSVNGLRDEPDIGSMSKVSIWRSLEKRFDINDVKSVKQDHLTVEYDKVKRLRVIRVKYEYRVPLYGNVDALLSFDFPLEVPAT